MRGIFISYRRDDAEGQAGRLFDDLSAHFGRDAVFMDVAGIKKGLDFRRIIDAHVASCGVLLVIIGKRWLPATDSKGKRRLDDANDFVRLETAAALSRDIPVVPVLVQDAIMPTAQELPDALKELAFRNGTELTHARWDSDVKLLIEDLKPFLDTTPTPAPAIQPTRDQTSFVPAHGAPSDRERRLLRRPLWAVGGVAAVAGGFAIFGYQLLDDRPAGQSLPLVVAQASSAPATQPRPTHTATPPPVVVTPSPKVEDEPRKLDPLVAEAEAAKAVAAKAAAARAASDAAAAKAASARAAAAKREADEARRREEVERSAQWAEEQRKRDEDARRIAQEQAEKQRIAAEQAAAARMFTDIATAILGSRQNNRR